MSREKECDWHFDLKTGRAAGVSDAMMQNFKEKPYRSLVRESIQNSMDAVADENKPVKVMFSFKSINSNDFENFFHLRKHIKGCIDYFYDDEKAKLFYGGMLKNFPETRSLVSIDYIRVSDFNTKGMWYIDDLHTNSPFFAFVRAAGVSSKDKNTSGGSYGFGKSAYYQISPIATVIVSSMTQNEEYAFEGATALSTNVIDGKIYTDVGYYDNNNGNPVRNLDNIPVPFKRYEPGTDVNIMAFNLGNKNEAKNEIINETLKNFWYAIFDKKLEVVVDDMCITANNLDELMRENFPSLTDTTKKATSYNPRPYYEAVVHADEDDDHVVFKDRIPLVGDVSLYVIKTPEATDKVAYFRMPRMLVFAKATKTTHGVYGTFICDDPEGNEILKHLEDPSHGVWKSSNWKDANNRTVAAGQAAIEKINDFVTQKISSLFETSVGDESEITQGSDYLYVPSELLPDEDAGSQDNPFAGAESGEMQESGNVITTNVTTPIQDRTNEKTNIGTVHVVKAGNSAATTKLDPDGKKTAKVGIHTRSEGKKKKKGKGNSAGSQMQEVSIDDNVNGDIKTFLPVRFRVVAQNEDGSIVHHIMVYSDYDVTNGQIELMVGGETSDEAINVKSCSQGYAQGNTISNLVLKEGKNTIKIVFFDNMRYTIKLKAYEIK